MAKTTTFDEFCRREYPAVYRACFAFCGDPEVALDCTQEAFGRAYARWRRLSKHRWAGGWVMTTALNLVRRSLRRRRDTPEATLSEQPNADLRMDVVVALRFLPLRQRQAVVLHYLADLPVTAVAELMNASEGSVKTHLSRARQRLGPLLISYEPGGDT